MILRLDREGNDDPGLSLNIGGLFIEIVDASRLLGEPFRTPFNFEDSDSDTLQSSYELKVLLEDSLLPDPEKPCSLSPHATAHWLNLRLAS